MAYNKKDLERQALKIIDKYKCVFMIDVIVQLPCSKQTFYNHKLDQLDSIKSALEKNKTVIKQAMRKDWYDSGNPTLQLALYRLMATPEEHARLNNSTTTVVMDGNDTEDVPTIIVQPIKQLDE